MSTKIYEMTQKTINIIKAFQNTTCRTCGKPFKIGDEVISTGRPKGKRIRHLKCAKKIGLI